MKYRILRSIFCISFSIGAFSQEKKGRILSGIRLKPTKIRAATKFQKENKMFLDLLNGMEQIGFYPLKLKDWSNAYKDNIKSEIKTKDSIFIQIPRNHPWKGKKDATKSEYEDVFFKNARITEVVLKQKTASSMRQDIKIVQFIFESTEQVKAALPKMKKIGAYTISVRGLKSPNLHWGYENTIYFCRVRAAAFSTKPFLDVFEKKYRKVEVLRW